MPGIEQSDRRSRPGLRLDLARTLDVGAALDGFAIAAGDPGVPPAAGGGPLLLRRRVVARRGGHAGLAAFLFDGLVGDPAEIGIGVVRLAHSAADLPDPAPVETNPGPGRDPSAQRRRLRTG